MNANHSDLGVNLASRELIPNQPHFGALDVDFHSQP